jgi:hypothetical protein
MTPKPSFLALLLGLALTTSAAAATNVALKMDPQTQQRLGVVTAPLTAVRRTSNISGFARSLDAGPLALLDSDISAAAAALMASQAEASRTRDLHAADQTVSQKVAQAAAAQARADAAKLQMLRRRLGLEWGPSLAALSDTRRGQLIADIAAGHASLVRIDAPGGLGQFRGAASIDLGAAGMAKAEILGPARVGDPRLMSTGLLALVRGPHALQFAFGAVAPARAAAGAEMVGVIIPRTALLRTAGQTFAYVRRDSASFERRAVVGGATDPAGLFVTSGFKPGDQVVTKGAAQLFAAETPAAKAD